MSVDFDVRNNRDGGKVIVDYGLVFGWVMVKNILKMDLFLTNMQLFHLQDINLWTGVLWITVFSSCLDSHYDAPIHCGGSIGEKVM